MKDQGKQLSWSHDSHVPVRDHYLLPALISMWLRVILPIKSNSAFVGPKCSNRDDIRSDSVNSGTVEELKVISCTG